MGMLFTNLQETNKDFAFEFFVTDKQQKDWSDTDTPFFTGKNIVYLADDVYHNFNRFEIGGGNATSDGYSSTGSDTVIAPGMKCWKRWGTVEFSPNVTPTGGLPTNGSRLVKLNGFLPSPSSPGAVNYRNISVVVVDQADITGTKAVVTPILKFVGTDLWIKFAVADTTQWPIPPTSVVFRADVSIECIYVDS